jgi:excisionase family DNA binding protein
MSMVMERPERLVTPKDAAARLAVSMPTIERLLRRGAIPSIQVAGTRTRRIREADIDQIVRFGFVEASGK